ncbi:MAG: hypothetical protein IJ068_02825 [Bacilli bacterium]|nr:hypothetical protein [Bacilli bacterium]
MIENCITDKTNPIIIKTDKLIEFNVDNAKEYEKLARRISEETGVPKGYIFTAPYYFFIDHWYKIGNEWYFYKSDGYDFHFINELLGEIISKYFDLDTVHYNVAKLCVKGKKEEYGLLSKNFCDKNYLYKTTWDYGLVPNRDLNVLNSIRDICESDSEYLILLKDLKKFFIRDFYVSQLDRTGNNFMFKVNKEGIRLAPLYDYENSFESCRPEVYRNQIAEINLLNNETRSILTKDEMLQELLHSIIQIRMDEFLQTVEDTHNIAISSDLKDYYTKRDEQIKRLIKEHRVIK